MNHENEHDLSTRFTTENDLLRYIDTVLKGRAAAYQNGNFDSYHLLDMAYKRARDYHLATYAPRYQKQGTELERSLAQRVEELNAEVAYLRRMLVGDTPVDPVYILRANESAS
jgi:hypothetical protein